MKRIGITYTETNFKNYPAWFTKEELGDDFELVILSFIENNVQDIERCDGFVLTGGIDVDPSFYEGALNYPNRPANFSTARDEFEAKVYWYAMEESLPVLGICRGMQLIHVLEGGELIQDLGEQNARHRSDGQDKEHSIDIAEGSLLHAISGQLKGNVNSAHHQGVDVQTLSEKLQANAWSTTGPRIVEGLEFKEKSGKPFMICVQWHPERIAGKESNPLSQNIKEQFLAAVKNLKK